MRNLILLLVLVAGLLGGYFVGDYRGKDAREALERAIETGNKVEQERLGTISALKADLKTIDEKHAREINAIRQDFEARSVEWQLVKARLDQTILRQKSMLGELNTKLAELTGKAGTSTGSEKDKLEQEIARLRMERANLEREMKGNVCLETQVPRSVIDALGPMDDKGRK